MKQFSFIVASVSFNLAVMSAAIQETLISTQDNIRVEHWHRDYRDLQLPVDAKWSVRKSVLRGGKQEGVDLIEVDNGRLRFAVVPTRGMSVYEVVMGDVRLGWNSPVKELVHPQHVNLQSRGGLGWLEGFNEWMVRCGLESAGHPGEDRFINNTGDEATMNLTLHGKIGNIPASKVQVILETKPLYRIKVRGRVDERMFYGPQLELWTEIAAEIGSNTFTIQDSLTNRGGNDQEFQLIYHANFGPPLLGEGAQLVAPPPQSQPLQPTRRAIHQHSRRLRSANPRIRRACLLPPALGRSLGQNNRHAPQSRRQPRRPHVLVATRTSLLDPVEKLRRLELRIRYRN